MRTSSPQIVLAGFSGSVYESLLLSGYAPSLEADSFLLLEDTKEAIEQASQCGILPEQIMNFNHYAKSQESYQKSSIFVSVASMPHKRMKIISSFASRPHISLPALIHPSAIVSPYARIGSATFLDKYVTVEYLSTLENGTYVNSHSHIGHNSLIGSGVVIGGGVVINGSCNIGDNTLLGSGCIVKNGVHIGANCLVQAGAVVLSNMPEGFYIEGNPAKAVCSSKLFIRN